MEDRSECGIQQAKSSMNETSTEDAAPIPTKMVVNYNYKLLFSFLILELLKNTFQENAGMSSKVTKILKTMSVNVNKQSFKLTITPTFRNNLNSSIVIQSRIVTSSKGPKGDVNHLVE